MQNLDFEPKYRVEWTSLQSKAYLKIAQAVANDVEWLMIIDTDEFLYPVEGYDLREVLKNYDNYASISVPWSLFGTSKVKKIPDNMLIIDTLKMNGGESLGGMSKSIAKPRYIKNMYSAHFPILKDDCEQVTEKYTLFKGGSVPYPSQDIIAFNHYILRDLDFLLNIKMSRMHVTGSLNETEKEKKLLDMFNNDNKWSSHPDSKILKYVPYLEERIFGGNCILSGEQADDT